MYMQMDKLVGVLISHKLRIQVFTWQGSFFYKVFLTCTSDYDSLIYAYKLSNSRDIQNV